MREYNCCEIDYEVGDIVRFQTDDAQRPFKVLSIRPRFITNNKKDKISDLLSEAYHNLKVGDEINPAVKIEVLDVGEEGKSWREDIYDDEEDWDAAYFTKIELEDVERLINTKEKRIVKEQARLERFKKIKEQVVDSNKNKM